jgi:molecular chaperone HscC
MAIVGIDLGTTNSLVSVWTENGPALVENALGDTLTPSAVSIADDGVVLIGRAALDRLITAPDRSIAAFKRWMGSVTGAELAGTPYRAEELSALVLRSLKEDAEAKLGEAIDEAVISVPAYFNDPQRKATLDASRLAGLKVERLINEPTAAALAYGMESMAEGQFLVLDLGGGTFDVSLLHKYDGVMEVRSTAGDSLLGGNDFRDVVVTLLMRRHGCDINRLAPRDVARALREADTIKHALTDALAADYSFHLGESTLAGKVTRDEFEEVAQPLIKRMRAPIERAIRDARVELSKVDQIVLVGGATRMPLIRRLAAKLFGRLPLTHPRPDHIVALGAAVQAGLKARHSALEDVIMTDVCPFTLGISVIDQQAPGDKLLSPIIERNAMVPISRVATYCTVSDWQTKICIEVLQGENIRPSQNIQIGEVTVPVPSARRGKESVDVRYTYDINGALEVEVKVNSTKHSERRIFRNQANLSVKELEARFAALSEIKLAPRDQVENRALIAHAERLFAESLGDTRTHVLDLLQQFEMALKDQHLRNPKALRESFAKALRQFENPLF